SSHQRLHLLSIHCWRALERKHMAFDETTTISHPPEQVFSGLLNRDFHIYASDAFRAALNEFSAKPSQPASSDTVSVNIQRTVDGEEVAPRLPSAVQRSAKGRIQMHEDEAWSAAADDGSRDANVTSKLTVDKATAKATIKLTATEDGTGTVVKSDGSVKSYIQ